MSISNNKKIIVGGSSTNIGGLVEKTVYDTDKAALEQEIALSTDYVGSSRVFYPYQFLADPSNPDNHPQLQNGVDYISSTGGGTLMLDAVYETKMPLLNRSLVTVDGVPGSGIKNTNASPQNSNDGIALMMGNYRSTGTPPNITGEAPYLVGSAEKGSVLLTLLVPAEEINFSVDAVVFIYNDDGPNYREYQQVNTVVELLGAGVIRVKRPLYKDLGGANPKVSIANTGNILGVGSAQPSAYLAHRAGIKNISLYSETYNALGFSGMYESVIENIDILKSNRLFNGNCAAHCSVKNISGVVREQGINCAYFSHNTTIDNVDASWDGRAGGSPNAAVLLEENAHHLTMRNISIDAGAAEGSLDVGVRVSKSAHDNYVELNYSSASPNATALSRTYSDDGMPAGNNKIIINSNTPNATRSQVTDNSTGNNIFVGPDEIIDTNIKNPASQERALVINNLGLLKIKRLASVVGGYTIGGSCPGVSVDGWEIDDNVVGPATDASNEALIQNVTALQDGKLNSAKASNSNYALSSSTATDNVILSSSIPAGSLKSGDKIAISVFGECDGANGTKEIEVWITGDTGDYQVAGCSVTAGNDVAFSIEGNVVIRNTSEQRSHFREVESTNTTQSISRRFNDTDTTGLSVEIRAYCSVSGDSFFIYSASIQPIAV